MTKPMDLSIVIINKNERSVDKTLSLIKVQDSPFSFEVIIVDGSNGRLDDIYKQYPFAKVVNFVSKTNKSITIPEQRNVGVRNARSDIVVFIDAGCEPVKQWLGVLVAPIIRGEESITAGSTYSTGKPTFHDRVANLNKGVKYIKQAPTINLAIHKKVFDKVGYFDEALDYGSDLDFTWRVNTAGVRILNLPDASLLHDWGSVKQELKRGYRYGRAKTRLYRKHHLGLDKLIRNESTLIIYSLFIILLPVVILTPYYLLLLTIPFIKNIIDRNSPVLVIVNLCTALGALREAAGLPVSRSRTST